MEKERRIVALEQAVGFQLPSDYREFLDLHVSATDTGQPELIVSSNPEHWSVHDLLEIGRGDGFLQVDETYRLVGDVMPNGMLPIATDTGGNFFLVDCREGAACGAIYWWNHEQDVDEDRIQKVAGSFGQFLEGLIPAAQ